MKPHDHYEHGNRAARTAMILCVGEDHTLQTIRRHVLEKSGFRVYACASYEFTTRFRFSGCMLAVLCHSLTVLQRKAVLVRLARWAPHRQVVLLGPQHNLHGRPGSWPPYTPGTAFEILQTLYPLFAPGLKSLKRENHARKPI